MAVQNTRLGIQLMIVTVIIFATQDGISRHLGGTYNIWMVIAIRYWAFAAFVIAMAMMDRSGPMASIKSHHTPLQMGRGFLLAAQICVAVTCFTQLGLVGSHAILSSSPLIIAALSGPILGEKVGWRRWSAIFVGFVGIMIVLNPGSGVFRPEAVWAVIGAVMLALYGLLTRYVGARDPAKVSLFWIGTMGAVMMTPLGIWHWEPMSWADWAFMLTLCCTGIFSHFLMIRAYEVAEASAIQPFAYLQLVFVTLIGLVIFDEVVTSNIVIGAAIVVAAGIFTILRTAKVAKAAAKG